MCFGKISTYTCIHASKFCMQALFLMQIQILKSDCRGFEFLLFFGIKSESNQYIRTCAIVPLSDNIRLNERIWSLFPQYTYSKSFFGVSSPAPLRSNRAVHIGWSQMSIVFSTSEILGNYWIMWNLKNSRWRQFRWNLIYAEAEKTAYSRFWLELSG